MDAAVTDELKAETWRRIAERNEARGLRLAEQNFDALESLIAVEREHYLAGRLEVWEFEQRVDVIMYGQQRWWIG